uniref:MARVEL domain-containing protein n=1 Tax=Malurus cyaneus samueli TaxID=2593467 RepID=A0A8C5TWP3_9PASS
MEGASFGQPQTLIRVTTWIFSIVVFGSIINECYVNKDSQHPELLCIFNENESACSYGIAVGVIAFFGCIFFFVVDLYFQQISSVKDRKRAVLLDLGFSGTSALDTGLTQGTRGCPRFVDGELVPVCNTGSRAAHPPCHH